MKTFTGSLFVKLSVFVLLCLIVPVFGISVLCGSSAYDEGLYEKEVSFANSPSCRYFVRTELANVREYIYWNDIEGLISDEYYFDHKNFAYAIFDAEGRKVFSTVKPGFVKVVSDYPAKEVTEEGETVAEYTINGYVAGTISNSSSGYKENVKFNFLKEYRMLFLYCAGGSFALCALLCIYLAAFSGYDKNGILELRFLNSIEVDILLVIYGIAMFPLIEYTAETVRYQYSDIYKVVLVFLLFAVMTALTLVVVMNLSAHFKMKHWWKHSIIWQFGNAVVKFFCWALKGISIMWKLAAIVAAYSFCLLILGFLSEDWSIGPFAIFAALLVIAAGVCIAIWFGSQLKKIELGGRAIAGGDFDYRIESEKLWPMLREHADNLNGAAKGMSRAVDDRMKSERFKTELITNVSHDLKTPLTSIVSYVDLLKKEDIENENAKEYIEVIDRQSAKLKKLTEDLVEASKASSGAVTVNREILNIGELINQSVGEFSEKLEAAEILPVINIPEEEVKVFTDGRLLWRVFDNLIQNIIKYAQPGTRAYFDLLEGDGFAVLTIRNISKEPLNMTAEALMERFVRGDASRNSEGNGLGLSIASSLTELCGGVFELTLDGDLYKVTITLPVA